MYEKYNYNLNEEEQSYKWCHQYAYEVLNNKRVACDWIKKACKRHFDDLEKSNDDDYLWEFSPKHAQRIIDFYQFIKHTKGPLAGQSFKLMPWQIWILGSIIGWVTKKPHPTTNKKTRRFKRANVWIARKNGKSTLAAGLALYMLLADGEQGAEVYSAATTRDQARIVFDDACVMLSNSDLKEVARVYQAEIKSEVLNAKFKPLSSDHGSLDGLNTHLSVIDEIHAHKDRGVYDVMETSTGARTQPLIFVISTAGTILDGIATELWKYGEQVLDKVVSDDTFFSAQYTIDKGDDFTKPEIWLKSNPALGVAKSADDMRDLVNKALAMPSARSNVLTKHLNVFVSNTDTWLDAIKVQSLKSPIKLNDYKGRECYIGLDLAQKLDLTAIALIFPNENGGIDVFFKHYIPESAVSKSSKQKQSLYDKFKRDGFLEITEGVATNFEYIENDLREYCRLFNVKSIGYDPYAATQMSFKLTEENLPMVSVPQNYKNLSEPAKEMENLIMVNKLRHNDDLFVWCCSNTRIKVDQNENIKPVKDGLMSENKIDSVIALITALSLCVLKEPEKQSVYEKRGLLLL